MTSDETRFLTFVCVCVCVCVCVRQREREKYWLAKCPVLWSFHRAQRRVAEPPASDQTQSRFRGRYVVLPAISRAHAQWSETDVCRPLIRRNRSQWTAINGERWIAMFQSPKPRYRMSKSVTQKFQRTAVDIVQIYGDASLHTHLFLCFKCVCVCVWKRQSIQEHTQMNMSAV
jgi:hypothetical protein